MGEAGADEAFDEVVDVGRDENAVADLVDRVSRASHALEGARDALGRADHHDSVDVTDVDPELEAGGADHGAQVARLEPVLDLLADVAVERGMVAFDGLGEGGQGELEPVGDAFGAGPRVREEQGGAIPLDDPGHVGDDARSGVAGGRVGVLAQRREHLDERAASGRDFVDLRHRSRSAEKGGDGLERGDGGGETDAAKGCDGCLVRIPETAEMLEALERDAEVGAAFVFGEGVQLVDDDEVAAGEGLAEAGLGEENGEALRRRHEEVGRLAALFLPLRRARVASAESHGDDPVEPESGEGFVEIFADVVGEGAQRRDVEAADALGPQAALVMLAGEAVDDAEEAGERFPRSRGRGEQHRSSRGDVGDAEALPVGGTPETLPEPRRRGRVEGFKKGVVGVHADGYGGARGPARRGVGEMRGALRDRHPVVSGALAGFTEGSGTFTMRP